MLLARRETGAYNVDAADTQIIQHRIPNNNYNTGN